MHRASNYIKGGVVTFLCSILVGFGVAPLALATSSTMYLSPASKSVGSGQTVTENIYIDTGSQQADTVNVVVHYDTSKLQYVSYTTGSSKFGLFPGTANASGGEVKWVGTDLGNSTTGEQYVGSVSFKSRASSGSTDLTLAGSNIARAGNSLNPSLSGSTVSFTGSNGSSPSQPPSSSQSGGNGGANTSPSSQSNTTSLTQTGIQKPTNLHKKVNNDVKLASISVQYTRADLHLAGQDITTASIRYGIREASLEHVSKATSPAKNHDITLVNLQPASQYFYKVTTTDKTGHSTTGPIQSFMTKGFDLAVIVKDKNGKVLKGKTVVIDSADVQKTDTSDQGVAKFSNITPGLHHVSYTTDGQTYSAKVTVKNNVHTEGAKQTATLQNVSVILPLVQPSSNASWIILAIIVAVIILLAISRRRLLGIYHRSASKS